MQDDDELIALEHRRCEAIARGDVAGLRHLLRPDYLHVHATGQVDNLDGHLDAIARRPRTPSACNLVVRRCGDTALLIGDQINRTEDGVSHCVATRVLVRVGGTWQFAAVAVTRKT